MSNSSVPDKVPGSAKPFFQEYNFDHLDVTGHAAIIIERILAYGNRNEVRWLLSAYGREKVRDWVDQAGNSRLPWRRYHLWCFVFGIPLQKKPQRIWPY